MKLLTRVTIQGGSEALVATLRSALTIGCRWTPSAEAAARKLIPPSFYTDVIDPFKLFRAVELAPVTKDTLLEHFNERVRAVQLPDPRFDTWDELQKYFEAVSTVFTELPISGRFVHDTVFRQFQVRYPQGLPCNALDYNRGTTPLKEVSRLANEFNHKRLYWLNGKGNAFNLHPGFYINTLTYTADGLNLLLSSQNKARILREELHPTDAYACMLETMGRLNPAEAKAPEADTQRSFEVEYARNKRFGVLAKSGVVVFTQFGAGRFWSMLWDDSEKRTFPGVVVTRLQNLKPAYRVALVRESNKECAGWEVSCAETAYGLAYAVCEFLRTEYGCHVIMSTDSGAYRDITALMGVRRVVYYRRFHVGDVNTRACVSSNNLFNLRNACKVLDIPFVVRDRLDGRTHDLTGDKFRYVMPLPTEPKGPEADKADDRQSFVEAVEPAMKWLAENRNPHHAIYVENDRAVVMGEERAHVTNKFIKD